MNFHTVAVKSTVASVEHTLYLSQHTDLAPHRCAPVPRSIQVHQEISHILEKFCLSGEGWTDFNSLDDSANNFSAIAEGGEFLPVGL
jgi:hypothetical protein